PKKLLWRVLAEVVALDIQLAREWHLPRAGRRILRIVHRLELFDLSLGEVVDHHLKRAEHGHHSRRPAIQVLADRVLQYLHVNRAVELGDSNAFAKGADRLGCVNAPPQAADGRHPWIVPTADVLVL